MRAFDSKRSVSRFGRHPVLVSALAVLLLGSLGFAAAGGIEMVRSWFVTIEVNGEVIGPLEVVPDENGNAEFDIPPIEIEGDEAAVATITIDSGECGEGDGEGSTKTVSVTLDEDGGHIRVEQEEEDDEEED